MKIVAWKCPSTGKIFENEKTYKNYRRLYLCETRRTKILNDKIAGLQQSIEELRLTATSVDDISSWILKNGHALNKSICRCSNKHCGFTISDINWSIEYSETISNSHSCPINGVKNFYRRTDIAQYYPGWKGTLHFKTTNSNRCRFFSEIFDKMHVHLGSGSGNSAYYSSMVNLYEEDWPSMAAYDKLIKQ